MIRSLHFQTKIVSQRFLCSTLFRGCSNDHSKHTVNINASAAPQSEFNVKIVEEVIKKSAKDMPIDITNPYERDRIQCILCRYKIKLDYKNVKLLSQFVSTFTGNIYERHITRLCKTQQDLLVNEIRRSRLAGFMPVMFKSVEMMRDPKLFDPNNPIKPHPF